MKDLYIAKDAVQSADVVIRGNQQFLRIRKWRILEHGYPFSRLSRDDSPEDHGWIMVHTFDTESQLPLLLLGVVSDNNAADIVKDHFPRLKLSKYRRDNDRLYEYRWVSFDQLRSDFMDWAVGHSVYRPIDIPQPVWLNSVREDYVGSK